MMLIGELSELTGCKPETIRYYERVGVLAEPQRTGSGYRRYGPDHIERLNFVRGARQLGFSLGEVRELISLSVRQDRSCEAVDAIARRHLEQVRLRISKLRGLARELERMIDSCDGERIPDCRILQAMPEVRAEPEP